MVPEFDNDMVVELRTRSGGWFPALARDASIYGDLGVALADLAINVLPRLYGRR